MKFENLIKNLVPTNHSVVSYRYHRIVKTINQAYWGINSDSKNCRYVGSYGRGTAIKGFSDVDILVILPEHLFSRFSIYKFNGQSSLLQNVKSSLITTYARTRTKADGQVIIIEFSDGLAFEVVPAFSNGDKFSYPDSNHSGNWKHCNPIKEIEAINIINNHSGGRLKKICKLARAWKVTNNVNISGILIDCLAMNFILMREKEYTTLELLFAEFLLFLYEQEKHDLWYILGSKDVIYREGMEFERKALKSVDVLLKGLDLENKGFSISANEYWKMLFGNFVNGVL